MIETEPNRIASGNSSSVARGWSDSRSQIDFELEAIALMRRLLFLPAFLKTWSSRQHLVSLGRLPHIDILTKIWNRTSGYGKDFSEREFVFWSNSLGDHDAEVGLGDSRLRSLASGTRAVDVNEGRLKEQNDDLG